MKSFLLVCLFTSHSIMAKETFKSQDERKMQDLIILKKRNPEASTFADNNKSISKKQLIMNINQIQKLNTHCIRN